MPEFIDTEWLDYLHMIGGTSVYSWQQWHTINEAYYYDQS